MSNIISLRENEIVMRLDCRMSRLKGEFDVAIESWRIFGQSYRSLPDFYWFQEDYLSKRMEEMDAYETWQEYSLSIAFEEFEAMLTFTKRIFYTRSLWNRISFIELIRAEHYKMRDDYDKRRDASNERNDTDYIVEW